MYSFCKQLHSPTTIEHSVYCSFFKLSEKNLVTAGVNQLNVYRLVADTDAKNADRIGKQKKHTLEHVVGFELMGNITSMQSVHLAGSSRDTLLLSFADAKLSLVEYDSENHDLKTVSLHYFEQDDLKCGAIDHAAHLPLIRVDPEGRCAGLLIYGRQLVILPFRRDFALDETSKVPIMSSYVIDLFKLSEPATNIIDFCFLHGYYEPTVLILYEPLPSWAGRVAVRRDSCSIVTLSLNLLERIYPIIWSVPSLPFDSHTIFPVPRPIGGIIVMATNSLLYLNQSLPTVGVSLNSLGETSTDYPLKSLPDVKISFDSAVGVFASYDRMIISLKGGELYVLNLLTDGIRGVQGFHLDKSAASVLTTSLCLCDEGYLFLGSRLGNSLLLKYYEKEQETEDQKLNALLDGDSGNVTDNKRSDALDDLDDLEVYGKSAVQTTDKRITQYTFEVCDSILNIGPCGYSAMGEPALLSEEFGNSVDFDIELVGTAGYGKNGAVCVLQRSVKPQVVTTFELPGCSDMWTVGGSLADSADSAGARAERVHSFLLLCRDDSTMVLKTGQEIMELDVSGFCTQAGTVFAGNLDNNRYIIQVTATDVYLLEGVTQLQCFSLQSLESTAIHCAVAEPYVALLMANSHVAILELVSDVSGARLQLLKRQVRDDIRISHVTALFAYVDHSGMMVHCDEAYKNTVPPATLHQQMSVTVETSFQQPAASAMDEDELLYGDTVPISLSSEAAQKSMSTSAANHADDIRATQWLGLARENGSLEILSLPELKVCFTVKQFSIGPRLLVDASLAAETASRAGVKEEVPIVRELLMVGLGHKHMRPYLLARVDEELLLYEAFVPVDAQYGHFRFKKLQHNLILRERMSKARKRAENDDKKLKYSSQWLRAFEDVGGYSGVFICGPYPHWLIATARGAIRLHPMSIDGCVSSFAAFNNVNCPKGFLYFNRQGEMRICVLPTHLTYDSPWPVRKVPLRCSPYMVLYHPDSKTYSIATSVSDVCTKVVKVVGDGEKEFETHERDEKFILPPMEKFSVQLYSPLNWEAVPNTKFEFEEFEHITSMKNVNLRSEGTISGLKGYIAVGTSYNYNEDVTCRGRVLIYDVIEVVPEPGQPLTKHKMKIEYNKEQKGAVTALDHVQGFLVTAIGQKIYIWLLKEEDLQGVAFIDTQVYITSIASIKNMLLLGDLIKSVSLLRYQEDMKVLSLVSRDIRPLEVYTVGFLVDNPTLSFVASDRQKNLVVFAYQPEIKESHGGQRLIHKADINIGGHVNSMFRVRCKLTDPSTERRLTGPVEKRHVTYYITLDGGIGYLLPLPEKTYRRLLMVQSALVVLIPHAAGLNPRAYRQLQLRWKSLSNPQHNILDGDLVWKFLYLNTLERMELAKRIGTSADQITEDLMEIDRITAHF